MPVMPTGRTGSAAAVMVPAGSNVEPRVGERNIVDRGAGIEWGVRGPVIHIVALNAVVHDAKAATDNGFAWPVRS